MCRSWWLADLGIPCFEVAHGLHALWIDFIIPIVTLIPGRARAALTYLVLSISWLRDLACVEIARAIVDRLTANKSL